MNFMQTVWEMGATKEQFAAEVEKYFTYHSMRKANVQRQLEEQLQAELDKGEAIQSHADEIEQSMVNQESEMYKIFVEYINKMKEDLRQRKTLTQLKNVKTHKIRTDQIDIPELGSINIS